MNDNEEDAPRDNVIRPFEIVDNKKNKDELPANLYKVYDRQGSLIAEYEGYIVMSGSWVAIADDKGMILYVVSEGLWGSIVNAGPVNERAN